MTFTDDLLITAAAVMIGPCLLSTLAMIDRSGLYETSSDFLPARSHSNSTNSVALLYMLHTVHTVLHVLLEILANILSTTKLLSVKFQ